MNVFLFQGPSQDAAGRKLREEEAVLRKVLQDQEAERAGRRGHRRGRGRRGQRQRDDHPGLESKKVTHPRTIILLIIINIIALFSAGASPFGKLK